MFGTHVVTGKVLGTGSAIAVDLGFKPTRVEIAVLGNSGFWNEDLIDGTFAWDHIQQLVSGNTTLGVPYHGIGSTAAQWANGICHNVFVAAPATVNPLAATAAGTAFTATTHDVAAGHYAAFIMCAVTADSITIVKGSDCHSRALAIASIAGLTPTSLSAVIGACIITGAFDATTDDLTTSNFEKLNVGGMITGGITPKGAGASDTYKGFSIGTNGNLNISGVPIYFKAFRD